VSEYAYGAARAHRALEAQRGAWRLGAALRHSARQDRVPALDTPTPAYTMLDLWALARLPLPGDAQAWLRLNNATDQLGYNAAAVAVVPALVPLPGCSLDVGLRWAW
jgi:iron complex outermembrane receptor protein